MWEILKTTPTNDIKLIKRAYAKQLKLTRPDEKPKEFQALNEAYQVALNYAKDRIYEEVALLEIQEEEEARTVEIALETLISNISIPETSYLDHQGVSEESFKKTIESDVTSYQEAEAIVSENIVSEVDLINDQPQGDELSQVLKAVEVLLKDKKKRQLSESWNFLVETPSIFDPHFHWELSKSVLVLLYEHREKSHKDNMPVNEVRASVLFHIDGILNWIHDEDFLRYEVGGEVCDTMLPLIHNFIINRNIFGESRGLDSVRGAKFINQAEKIQEEENRKIGIGSSLIRSKESTVKVKRILSFFLDLLIFSSVFLICYFLFDGFLKLNKEEVFVMGVVLYVFYIAYHYTSKKQATIGQRIFKIKITSQNNDPIYFRKALAVAFSFLLTMFLVLISILLLFIFKFFLVIPAIIVVIKCYQADLTLHDKLTFTRIVNSSNKD